MSSPSNAKLAPPTDTTLRLAGSGRGPEEEIRPVASADPGTGSGSVTRIVLPVPADSMTRLRRELQALYGAAGDEVLESITAAVERAAAGIHGNPSTAGPDARRRAWTEPDALVITYGDQIRAPGEPPLRTLHRFLRAHLTGLVDAVHLLPVYPWSSDDGFAVVDHTRIDPALGTWQEVSAIGADFAVMLDVVLNHVSGSHPWLAGFLNGDPAFDDHFVEVSPEADLSAVIRPRSRPLITRFRSPRGDRRLWTTFSADQVDLNYRNPRVLTRMVDVVLGYLAHGAALLRLDAVGYSWKEQGTSCLNLEGAHRLVRVLRASIDAVAPAVALVTETNVPHLANVAYFGDGTDEAQAVYQFPLPPLVLHAFLTGDATRLASWITTVGQPPPGCVFLNFLASHDGIGLMPAHGLLEDTEIDALVERVIRHGGLASMRDAPLGPRPYELNTTLFDALSDPNGTEPESLRVARFLAANSVMLALAGVPAIYVHSLFGSSNDRTAAEQSLSPRRINRARFDERDLEAALADSSTRTHRVFEGYAELLRARASHPAFDPAAPQRVLEAPPGVFALERGSSGTGRVACLVNVTAAPQDAPAGVSGTDLLTGLDLDADDRLELSPYRVAWLAGP